MINESRPSRHRLSISAGALAVTLTTSSVAHATDSPIPQGSTDDVVGTIATFGPVIGSMYVLYAVASSLLARYRSSSWLAQGKRLAITTGTLGVIGAGIQAQIAGSPFTLILAAAVAAAFKLITPTASPSPLAVSNKKVAAAASSVVLKATAITMMLMMAIVACGSSQGGPTLGDRVGAGVDAAAVCEEPNIKNAAEQLIPALVKFIQGIARGNGTIDRDALKAAAQPFKDTAYQCAMDVAVAVVSAARSSDPASILAGSDAPESLSATWTQVRSELGWKIPQPNP